MCCLCCWHISPWHSNYCCKLLYVRRWEPSQLRKTLFNIIRHLLPFVRDGEIDWNWESEGINKKKFNSITSILVAKTHTHTYSHTEIHNETDWKNEMLTTSFLNSHSFLVSRSSGVEWSKLFPSSACVEKCKASEASCLLKLEKAPSFNVSFTSAAFIILRY